MAELPVYLNGWELLICAVIVFVAAIIQMSVGMGFGMLASPLVALVRPDIVPTTIMLVGLVVAFSGAWRERQSISLVELRLGITGRIVGSSMAFVLLALIADINAFLIFFGTAMLCAILMSASGIQVRFNKSNLFSLSIVSGLVGTITAVGAPPMAIIYHNRPPEIVRPTLNAFFGAGSAIGLFTLSIAGWMSWTAVFTSLLLLPAMGAGIYCSRYFRIFSSHWLSQLLLGASGLASIILILRGFDLIN